MAPGWRSRSKPEFHPRTRGGPDEIRLVLEAGPALAPKARTILLSALARLFARDPGKREVPRSVLVATEPQSRRKSSNGGERRRNRPERSSRGEARTTSASPRPASGRRYRCARASGRLQCIWRKARAAHRRPHGRTPPLQRRLVDQRRDRLQPPVRPTNPGGSRLSTKLTSPY